MAFAYRVAKLKLFASISATDAKPRNVMCNAMRTVIQIIFCFLILISCEKKNSKIVEQKIEPILIKIGYYPTFHQPAETIINLKDNYLIFYSPTSYSPIPPPPNEKGKSSREEEIENNEFKEIMKNIHIQIVYIASDESVWIGTKRKGLYKLNKNLTGVLNLRLRINPLT